MRRITAFLLGHRNLNILPTTSAFFWIAVAGVLNGWACVKFGELIASLGVKGGLFGALVSVCIAAAAVFWGYAFFRYFPNLQQTLGIVLGAVAIWLLTAK